MKTRDLNLVSSPAVARLENFESSRFLSLAQTAVTQYRTRSARLIPTRNVHRHSPFCIPNSFIEVADLKTLEKSGFLTPSQSTVALGEGGYASMAGRDGTARPDVWGITAPQLRIPVGARSTVPHYFPCGSPQPAALRRNRQQGTSINSPSVAQASCLPVTGASCPQSSVSFALCMSSPFHAKKPVSSRKFTFQIRLIGYLNN
jgi:hypothetical protein